ncbi:MAG: hypothetical protein FJX72_09305 [Armatimonadetes bacterium]|nr:hypothetical protein [Armatimonadota bacterium]
MLRVSIACLAITAIVAPFAPQGPGAKEYTAVQVSAPNVFRGENQSVAALNDKGEAVIVCGLAASKFATQAYFWKEGKTQPIGTLEGFDYTTVSAMNSEGTVVGCCYRDPVPVTDKRPNVAAYVWRHGRVEPLPTPAGWSSAAEDVNDVGDIVGGTAPPGESALFDTKRPTLWRGGKLTFLRGVPGGRGKAVAINNRGHIVVLQRDLKDYRRSRSYLWVNAKARSLGSLGGRMTGASALNERGEVVGWSSLNRKNRFGDEVAHAFLWSDGRMRDLGTFGGEMSYASGIDDAGCVVGRSDASPDDEKNANVQLAFVWDSAKGMRRLDRLTDLGGMASLSASAISPMGRIGGLIAPAAPAVYGTWRAAVLDPR